MPINHPGRENHARISGINLGRTRPPLIQSAVADVDTPQGWCSERSQNSVRFFQKKASLPSVSMRVINPTHLRVELDRKLNGKVVTESSVHSCPVSARDALLSALQQVAAS